MYLYSPSTGGFYRRDIHEVVPDDVIEVDEKLHYELLSAQAQGLSIVLREDRLVAEAVPVPQITWDDIRAIRRKLLNDSDWTVLPDSPLSPERRAEWVAYRQALRDITASHEDPAEVIWPDPPE